MPWHRFGRRSRCVRLPRPVKPPLPLILLSFSNQDHTDVMVGEGSVSLGSAADNDIVVAGLAAHHARLTLDQRGVVLDVLHRGARVHVNARPVHELAFLRFGDLLCLDDVAVELRQPDWPSGIDTRTSSAGGDRHMHAHGVLRGVSGVVFGKAFTIDDGIDIVEADTGTLRIGSGLGGRALASVHYDKGRFWLESRELGGTLLNGHRRGRASLHPGDQIVFGGERLVVECGMSSSTANSPAGALGQDIPPGDGHSTDSQAAQGIRSIWWLITAAGLIALAMAGVLYFGSRS